MRRTKHSLNQLRRVAKLAEPIAQQEWNDSRTTTIGILAMAVVELAARLEHELSEQKERAAFNHPSRQNQIESTPMRVWSEARTK